MDYITGHPFLGLLLKKQKDFLATHGLSYDEGIDMSTCAVDDDGEIIAVASRQENVIKCVAVDDRYQGEGLAASVTSRVIADAAQAGYTHLFIFTKPANTQIFRDLGFFPVAETDEMLLMENHKDGVKTLISSFTRTIDKGTIGAIVANCNPFTKGHRFLMETAAQDCDFLYVFVLSAEKSEFPAELRLEMVRQGTKDIPNISVCPTGDYLISAATFPDYFLKERANIENLKCELDLAIFTQCFAKSLNITRRYVGTEPYSLVTAAYNRIMKEYLPSHGIQVFEIPRLQSEGEAISASRVRELLASNPTSLFLQASLPTSTLELIRDYRTMKA